jgi:hypothetical protein
MRGLTVSNFCLVFSQVEKDIAGNYNVDLGVQISDGTARCSDVMYPECVDIFEAR